ncbi:MAG: hypothetical protein K9N34_01060 [Candidatus Marinimicrobia bacterium]|nr:hypothetical protein [Candidatus Neomarinimicrobiota bacterium]MCF7841167.1 hypothetical protein [Candidatus Neomarinimicrobiota bacterium]MCF7901932.1 hypothetical protein [Candidatus Neomarinimicrobiota bacterium]
MKINLFSTQQAQKLKQTLHAYELQYKAISTNIANLNNSSFQRVKTDFHEMLASRMDQSGLKTTHSKHIQPSSGSSVGGLEVDKENPRVDMSREMADLAENQIRYEFVSRALRQHYSGLSAAILGRNN